MITDPFFLAVSAVAILLGGVVKGFSGYGLPMVALPIMANFIPAPLVMSLLSVTIVVTNVSQAARPRVLLAMTWRFWVLYATLAAGIALGASILVTLPARAMDIVVGTAMVSAALARGSQPDMRLSGRAERWLQPVVGIFGGLIGGISAMFGPPLIVFMNLLGLTHEEFVVALSTAYIIGLVPMVVTLVAHGWMGSAELAFSLLATVPALAAMAVGRRIGNVLSPRTLSLALVALMLVSGLRILARGVFG